MHPGCKGLVVTAALKQHGAEQMMAPKSNHDRGHQPGLVQAEKQGLCHPVGRRHGDYILHQIRSGGGEKGLTGRNRRHKRKLERPAKVAQSQSCHPQSKGKRLALQLSAQAAEKCP